MSDLFGGLEPHPLPKPTSLFERMAEAQRQVEPVASIAQDAPPRTIVARDPAPRTPFKPEDFPGLPVASFSCYCGCVDEVLEPAPVWVTCWGKGCGQQMHRYQPIHAPPSGNARQLTDEERSRI